MNPTKDADRLFKRDARTIYEHTKELASNMRTALLGIQAASYIGLGALLCADKNWRLGTAQLLLCVITVLLYA